MRAKMFSVVVVSAIMAFLFGCAGMTSQEQRTAKGAAIGAGTGALIGGLAGDSKGAVVGGLSGGLIGGALGHYTYKQEPQPVPQTAPPPGPQSSLQADPQIAPAADIQTVAQAVAEPRLELDQVSALPSSVRPGNKVDLQAKYTISDLPPNAKVNVTETREILRNGQVVGTAQATAAHGNGTYTTNVPLMLPATAQPGEYEIRITVNTPGEKESKSSSFTVG